MAEPGNAFEDAQRELLKRIGRYRRAPSLGALNNRMRRYCGGDNEVDAVGSLAGEVGAPSGYQQALSPTHGVG